MNLDNGVGSGEVLTQWCVNANPGEQILRIRNGGTALCLAHRESSEQWCLESGWRGFLALRPGLQVLSGEAQVLLSSQTNLVKLQFFIDQGLALEPRPISTEPCAVLSEEHVGGQLATDVDSWYLALALEGREPYQRFARRLRCGESYQLLGFLLEQGASNEKLCELAGRYGVSVSHFRRLCRQALGGAAKTELREWRTAKALLSMVEGARTMTELALAFGFASSSHFSKEVRELVGVAPSSLIDITRHSSE